MPRRPNITPEQVEQMHDLYHNQRKTYAEVARIMGIHKTAAYYWLKPGKRIEKNKYNAERNRGIRPQVYMRAQAQKPVMPWQEEPPDTRPPGARLLGDPLPGRSALDKKLKERKRAADPSQSSDPFRPAAANENEPRGSR